MDDIPFKELYEGTWEIDPKLKDLTERLKKARIGYKCAINAIPYMPLASKPYTRETADKYFEEIKELKKAIKEITLG